MGIIPLIVKPESKSLTQVQQSSLKKGKKERFGIRAYTKITWATTPQPPLTFKHKQVLIGKMSQYDPPIHPGGKVDQVGQVDSKIKDMM